MPRPAALHRFDRLARDRAQAGPVAPRGAARRQIDRALHRARVGRALALAHAGGIKIEDAWPGPLRRLADLGLPARPLHFLPFWVPFLMGAVYSLPLAVALYATAQLLGGAYAPLARHADLAALALAVLTGATVALSIRRQAARARLPAWSEV